VPQPLVTRPGYGEQAPLATSKLPSGDPASKGLSLSDDIPGTKTFVKPLDDHNTDDPAPEQSLYRIDGPKDLAKKQDNGTDTIDQSDASPGYMGLGDKDPNDYSKTKYPYRDEKPNSHNASKGDPQVVAALYVLAHKLPLVIPAQEWGKYAATGEQILSGLNPKVLTRAQKAKVSVKRVDAKNLRWIFDVKGNHDYVVKLRASRPKKNTTKLSKMDLELSCTCPAWQWQGPEFHGKANKYQLGKLQGTATPPDIRDPSRINKVCKHVAAVLSFTQGWEIPAKVLKKQAVRFAMDRRALEVNLAHRVLRASKAGVEVVWADAPEGTSKVYLRATGEAEFKPSYFQMRREGEKWSSDWFFSSDLAGSLRRLGFNAPWDKVPPEVQAWALEDIK
jgi:hypothetical protein